MGGVSPTTVRRTCLECGAVSRSEKPRSARRITISRTCSECGGRTAANRPLYPAALLPFPFKGKGSAARCGGGIYKCGGADRSNRGGVQEFPAMQGP
jgi:hypothetical protein